MNQEALQLFKALSDPTRFQIVEHLTEEDLTTAELMERLQMSQPTIFRHLQKLKQAGIVEVCSPVNPARFRLCYPGLDLTLQQLLAGDPEGKTLEQLRKENSFRRYLERHRKPDGRWDYWQDGYYSDYILQDILNSIEDDREYTYSELNGLLNSRCVNAEDLISKLIFCNYLDKKEVPTNDWFRSSHTVYYRTGKTIHFAL